MINEIPKITYYYVDDVLLKQQTKTNHGPSYILFFEIEITTIYDKCVSSPHSFFTFKVLKRNSSRDFTKASESFKTM